MLGRMRRLILAASFGLPLVACASILGDFDVEPKGASDGGPTVDGSNGGDGGGSIGDGGTTADAGATVQPTAVAVATSLNATCATVKYADAKLVTYCWGEQGINRPEGLGATATDKPLSGNFYRPRLAQEPPVYPAFDTILGGATGDWFIGRGTSAFTSPDVYAWGDNSQGQCALAGSSPTGGPPAATVPNGLKVSNAVVNTTAIFAAPGTGCLTTPVNGKSTLYCWGHNNECQVTLGDQLSCNATTPSQAIPTLTDETTAVGSNGGLGIDQVVGGAGHMCAARHLGAQASGGGNAEDGIACWGDNTRGQCGQPTSGGQAKTYLSTPTQVSNQLTAKQGTFDLASGESHVCYLDRSAAANNVLWCWGYNNNGQINLGQSSTTPIQPQKINLPSDIANAGSFTNLTLGGDLTCIVFNPLGAKPSKAYCWGAGPRGNSSSTGNIAQVENIQEIKQLAVGKVHACAVARSNGAGADEQAGIWCWGQNTQLQVNPSGTTTQPYAAPVHILFPPEPTD